MQRLRVMELPESISHAFAELIAARLRLLGQPVRVKLITRLAHGRASVESLTTALGAKQQNVSQHLGLLYDAGVVKRHQEGRFVSYELIDRSVYELYAQVAQSLRSGRAGHDPGPED